jgi:histidinol-phosphatase (PHP family)
MSIHFVSAWGDDEWTFGFRESRPIPSVYRDYFKEMLAGIGSGFFDCVAHLDLIKQPGKPVLATNRGDVEDVLEACLAREMSVEINTSGTRKEVEETYPCNEIIRLMLERKVAIVTGSDAHAPSQVGMYFHQLQGKHSERLTERLVRYRGRKMEPVPSPGTPSRPRAGRC